MAKIISEKNTGGRLSFPDFKNLLKLLWTKQCGTGIRIDIYTNGIELGVKK